MSAHKSADRATILTALYAALRPALRYSHGSCDAVIGADKRSFHATECSTDLSAHPATYIGADFATVGATKFFA